MIRILYEKEYLSMNHTQIAKYIYHSILDSKERTNLSYLESKAKYTCNQGERKDGGRAFKSASKIFVQTL